MTLTESDDNWNVVVANLQKAWKLWAWLYKNIGWEGAELRTLGTFYKVLVQATQLFFTETWVI